ncbi:MAG: sulfotransferase family protein [Planctomycetota bacterium]|nr:MAG: sulfotransferase family protein [Planctomycetota bacterium]
MQHTSRRSKSPSKGQGNRDSMASPDQAFAQAQRLAAAGRLEEAATAAARILDDRCDHAGALQLFVAIRCRQERFRDAMDALRRAVAQHPDDPDLCAQLGDVSWAAGDVNTAVACYRKTLAKRPGDAQTQNNLGAALKARGEVDEAIACFRAAVAASGELVFPRKNLAEALLARGDVPEAIEQYEQAVRLAPRDAELHNALGTCLVRSGRLPEAIDRFRAALELRGDNAEIEHNLAGALKLAGNIEEAVVHARRAVQLQTDFVTARITLGNLLTEQGHVAEAITHYEHAVQLAPENWIALNNLGSALVDLGRFDEATDRLEAALRANPGYAPAYHNLTDLAKEGYYELSADQVTRMEGLIEQQDAPADERSVLQFSLAAWLEANRRYDEAFAAYEAANRLEYDASVAAGVPFDPAAHRELIDATLDTFSRELFKDARNWGSTDETPVFVVGMPRSGTTLVAQIIASHPEAVGADELETIGRLANQISTVGKVDLVYPRSVPHATEETIRESASRYSQGLKRRRLAARRVVDKMWHNFLFLGLIALLFPRARVVHCRRDARDVCFSCFARRLDRISWCWRFEDIGFYFREYERLMNHWSDVLPVAIYEVGYERLVGHQEEVSRGLIDFCGLDWHEGCLNFFESDGSVRSASRVQVRRPLYEASIGRWKHFENHLGKLEVALGASDASA